MFKAGEALVGEYFREVKSDPSRGEFSVAGERYLLVRASALSIDFMGTICQLYADRGRERALAIGHAFLFDIAHTVGMNDARAFHQKMKIEDPMAKLSTGPALFAYTGWASVEMLPDCHPTPDEDYLLYYNHPYSFEADAWLKSGLTASSPVCIMNSGYSSGWCEESFGLPLTAVETECRALGHPRCHFVMAPPHRIQEHLARLGVQISREGEGAWVPTFFERKQAEDSMRRLQSHLVEASRRAGLAEAATGVLHNLGNGLNSVSASVTELRSLTGGDSQELLEKAARLLHQQADLPEFFASDPRGRRFSSYLSQLSQKVAEEQNSVREQLDRLENKVNHLVEVVRSQQEAAGAGRVIQEMNLDQLLSESVSLCQDRLDRYGVVPSVECERTWICMDKGAVLQILTNLIQNAAEAVAELPYSRRSLVLTARVDGNQAVFEVRDNGVGIEPDDLESIFRHGYTTKADGHGFGLHSAAVLAGSLGGQLRARSAGPGQGSTFVLSLPRGSLD